MRRLPFLVAAVLALAPVAASAQPADWGVTRDPFDKNVIARYKGILAKNPHDAQALAKLLEMYRRYRTVDLLKEDYQKLLDKKADDWASLVVMGRLQHATGDDARARDLWSKAVAGNDADAESWIAIGELDKGSGHNKDARAAYDKALGHATGKEMKKKALRALADLALATGDSDGANVYFKQFLDLDPTNAQLWIDRGNAMLAAGKRDVALESYTAAEKLLGTDPTRRVEVVSLRGQALEGMGKDDEAVVEYRRAIKLVPKGYYLEVALGRASRWRRSSGSPRSCRTTRRRRRFVKAHRVARRHDEADVRSARAGRRAARARKSTSRSSRSRPTCAGRRGDRAAAEGACEEPERSDEGTRASASATSSAALPEAIAAHGEDGAARSAQQQGGVRARAASTSRPARR